jgi:hypothetical protein
MRPAALRGGLAAAVVAVVIAARAAPAAAEVVEEPRVTRLSVIMGVRANTGALERHHAFGALFGAEAAIHPRLFGERVLGLAWSVLWGFYGQSEQETDIEGALDTVEMAFGVRFRWRLPAESPMFVVLPQASFELWRGSVPIPPNDSRLLLGASVGAGVELHLGSWVLTMTASYGLIGDDAAGLRLLGGIGLGSR